MSSDRRRRLRDWKEIAVFFDRDERTVRRWERQRGLPVHRVSGGARNLVFAYTDELERWLRSGGGPLAADGTEEILPVRQENAEHSNVENLTASMPGSFLVRNRGRLAIVAISIIGMIALAGAVAKQIGPPHPLRLVYKPEPQVQSLFLDAVYALGTRQADGMKQATQLLTKATTIDPNYAEAYVKLAEAYNMISQYTLMPAGEAYPRALASANRAIALDPGNAEAHAALAFTTFYWSKDFSKSRLLFEQAIALDPDVAQIHHWYALTLMVIGETVIPLREISRAQELNPESRSVLANKGLILFYAGRVEEALSLLERLASAEPHLLSPHEYLATIYLDQGRMGDFLHEYRIAAHISKDEARLKIADAADLTLRDHDSEKFLSAMLAEQIRQFESNLEPAFKVAATAAMLGRDETALGYLEESFRRGESDIIGIRIEPPFRRLHADARFRTIVERVGFKLAGQSDS